MHKKNNALENVTWSVMGKQTVQAKMVYYFLTLNENRSSGLKWTPEKWAKPECKSAWKTYGFLDTCIGDSSSSFENVLYAS